MAALFVVDEDALVARKLTSGWLTRPKWWVVTKASIINCVLDIKESKKLKKLRGRDYLLTYYLGICCWM